MKTTNVIYSYFDQKEGKTLQSSTGVDIEGTVTPSRVKAAVSDKWKKTQYTDGVADSITIVHKETVR